MAERTSIDDLVLPYISRMLMEDDIDDKFFYQYPDHPALLQAQQPYAEILSDATNALSSAAAISTSSDSATTDALGGSGTFNLSPAPDDASVFANATWPYDPVELSQLLLSTPSTDIGVGLDGFTAGDANADITTLPAGAEDGEHGALASTLFSGQNRVTMEMLNLAFLKGMEEANKFLPTSNSLLRGESSLYSNLPAGEVTEKGVLDEMSMFQESGNGSGRKKRHNWDDLEAETGRNSKLMVPEPEETGEIVDKMITDGYNICLEKMEDLRITMGSKADKNTRKGNGKSGPYANQRLAHCFAEGLEARLAGTGSQVYKSLMTKRTSLVEFLKANHLYLAACCFQMMAIKFSNMTICHAIVGRKKVHIVDYGINYGFQWPSLLEFLGTWEGGTLEVRITGIDLPQPGFRPAARIEETGHRLSNCARQFGVPFKFHSIAAKWETVRVDDLNIDPDEVLIVNSVINFGRLMDEGVDIYGPSPRDMVLNNIREMRPDVFILGVVNGSYRAPFFVTRFREALSHYSAMFDMLDATTPRDNEQRLLVERDLIGRCALNVIACEGSDRVERPEAYKQWQARNNRAGLKQLPLYPDILQTLREKVTRQYHKDFVIDEDHQWFLQGWKGRILYAMSTWVADEANSEF
ncbi:hypothetical protein ACP70R_007949 [Stipagrostis hirtigluma subsp. patula]